MYEGCSDPRYRGGPGNDVAAVCRTITHMTPFTVELDDDTAERLRRRAEREGIGAKELARRLLTEASDEDPYEFFAVGSSDRLRGDRVDDLLAEHRFGES